MIIAKHIVKRFINSYYKTIEQFIESPLSTQEKTLSYLLKHGANTLFGTEHKFQKIKGVKDFKTQVPIADYENLKPYLDKIIIDKQSNVLWDSPVKWFAMSSGTTEDKSKYIPVTQESLLNGHYRAGHHMLGLYGNNYPDASYLFGKTLVIGGSQQINNIGGDIFTGDISAILMKNLPFATKFSRTPQNIALIPNWEEKLEKLSAYSAKEDIRALLGVPSWMLVLLKKVIADSGRSISDLWPNLEVFFHGGVSFTPYKTQYEKIIGIPNMRYWETYNASEGFFGIQYSKESKDMLLLLDNEIFYEFIPAEEWNSENPKAITLHEVEVGKQYAIVISTSGGLWRYKIGDTIEFTSTNPHLFRITGRTKQFINAFGEELIVDNTDKALQMACEATNSRVLEYTAAPVYFSETSGGAHEWIIEFEQRPENIELFSEHLDKNLKKLNSDYEAKRTNDLSLSKPMIQIVPPGIFYRWMKHRKKSGGQNKVPRLSNNRKYVDDIKMFVISLHH